ncbi:MAG: hypothetical protein RQ826_04485 [Xanthomonadales bacterium]|nr:hypothetical protein [Xanthomonadales bacterium]
MKANGFIDLAAGTSSRIFSWLAQAVIVSGLLLLPMAMDSGLDSGSESVAYAGNGQGGSGGGGDNGNGGGNSGGNNGGGQGGSKPAKGDLYGDMVYLLRNEDGVPRILNGCLRPTNSYGEVLALVGDFPYSDGENEYVPDDDPQAENGGYTLDGYAYDMCEEVTFATAKGGFTTMAASTAEDEDSVDQCDAYNATCASRYREVDLGRLSLLRSPDKVLDRSAAEATRIIGSADLVKLGSDGRIVADGVELDSPSINLALMREFHLYGELGGVFDPDEFGAAMGYALYDYEMAAAFGLGAADDKYGGGADSEVVARVDTVLQLAYRMPLNAPIVINEGNPDGLLAGKYIDYRDFTYDREATFPGYLCYDVYEEGQYVRHAGSIMDVVFHSVAATAENIEGYGLAADDARRVLVFVHDGLVRYIDTVYESIESLAVGDPECQAL